MKRTFCTLVVVVASVAAFLIVSFYSLAGNEGEKIKDDKALKLRPKPQRIFEVKKVKSPKQVYTVYLVNKSSVWTCIGVKAGASNWVMLPQPVGKTCGLATCDDCLKAGKYSPIMAVDCHDAAFDLYIMVTNSAGQIEQAGPARINPSCDFAGEAVCFDAP